MSNGYAIADDVVRFQAGWSVCHQNRQIDIQMPNGQFNLYIGRMDIQMSNVQFSLPIGNHCQMK
jgi:hypothetical protein